MFTVISCEVNSSLAVFPSLLFTDDNRLTVRYLKFLFAKYRRIYYFDTVDCLGSICPYRFYSAVSRRRIRKTAVKMKVGMAW